MIKRGIILLAMTLGYSTVACATTTVQVVNSTNNPVAVFVSSPPLNADGGIPVHLINGGGGGTSSNFTSAFPAAGTAAGGMSPGGVMMPFAVDASSNIKVNCVAGCSGSSGGGGTWVTPGVAISSGVPQMFINPSGNTQFGRVDASSNQYVTQGGPNFVIDLSTAGTPANPWTVKVPLAIELSSPTIGVMTQGPFTVSQGSASATASWRVDLSTVGTPANPLTVNVPLAVQLASNTINVSGVGAFTVVFASNGVNASTTNVVQPASVPAFRVDLSTFGTAANPITASIPIAVQLASPTLNVNGVGPFTVSQGSQSATASWRVDLSTVGTPANPLTVNVPLSVELTSGTPTNPFYVIGVASFTVTGAKADNGVAAGQDRLPTLPSIIQNTYENGTAATQGRNAALNSGTDGLLWTANLPSLRPADFHASSATQVAASATDIAEICGQATTATLLTRISVSCTQTTAGNVHLSILKRSNADQAGNNVGNTVSTMTVVSSNSNFSANSTTATYVFTGTPTRGGLVGQLDSYNVGCMATATATPNDIYISPAWWRTKPIVLNGIKECVAVSLANGVDGNGTTVTGGVFNINFDWAEVTAITP